MAEVTELRDYARMDEVDQLAFEGLALDGGATLVLKAPGERPWRIVEHGERLRLLVEGEVYVVVRTDRRTRIQVLVVDTVEEA